MRTRERIATASVTFAVAGSLLMLGSAPRWAACVATFAAIACALPKILSRSAGAHRSPLLWLFAAAGLFTAVQLIPMPAALVEILAPARHALDVDNATALGVAPSRFIAFTYDSAATWLELAKLVGYLVFAYACLGLARSRTGRFWLARTVAGAGIGMAACALLHDLLDLRTLFTVYQPESRPSSFLAPLLNQNHLAGFLAMTTPLTIGVAMSSYGLRRVGWVIGAMTCAAVALLVQSRGAAVALVVGLGLTGALFWWRYRQERAGRITGTSRLQLSQVIPAGVVVSCAVVLLATFTAGGVRDELAATSTDELQAGDTKVGLWRDSAELASDNSWTGIGRGAFELAFTRVHHSGLKTYSHVENEYLQTLVDWGLPATAVLSLLAFWLGLALLRHWRRSPLEVGALCALCTMALHSVVDFALEMPGVVFSTIAVSAILLAEKRDRTRPNLLGLRYAARLSFIAVAIAVTAIASSPVAESARVEAQTVADLMVATEVDNERVIDLGRQTFSRHPSDYLSAAQLAQAYFYRAHDPRALALMNRALALNPNHAGLHVFTAKMLRAGGRDDQALIEFALALRYTLEPAAVFRELLRAFPDAEQAARGIPFGRDRVPIMVNRLSTMQRPDVALAYALRAAEDMPEDFHIANLATELALKEGAIDTALAQSERAYRERGWLGDALWYGRSLRRAERLNEAIEVARAAIEMSEDQGMDIDVALYELYADCLLRTDQAAKAGPIVRTAIDLASGDRVLLGRLYNLLARTEQALGHPREAQEARRRAHEYTN